ncbi:MAG: DUF4372 domain-containing protein [Kiritimatiellae bacterium]|nr:DUF4372 domain-containing protein [Kiritimatiellia bacterium]
MHYNTIFPQLFQFLPQHRFENSVKTNGTDHYCRRQFLTCLYAQIAGKARLCHLGMEQVAQSTLANAMNRATCSTGFWTGAQNSHPDTASASTILSMPSTARPSRFVFPCTSGNLPPDYLKPECDMSFSSTSCMDGLLLLSLDYRNSFFPRNCRDEQVVLSEEFNAKESISLPPCDGIETVIFKMTVEVEAAGEVECRAVERCFSQAVKRSNPFGDITKFFFSVHQ